MKWLACCVLLASCFPGPLKVSGDEIDTSTSDTSADAADSSAGDVPTSLIDAASEVVDTGSESDARDSLGADQTQVVDDADTGPSCPATDCYIGGICIGAGTRNPSNDCQRCGGGTQWTDDNGHACDDGNACTVGDQCLNGQCAPGLARLSEVGSNSVARLGSGGIYPTSLLVDRGDQVLVSGTLDPFGAIELNATSAPDASDLDIGTKHVFVAGVATEPSWFIVVHGPIGISEKVLETHLLTASDSLDSALSIRVGSGPLSIETAAKTEDATQPVPEQFIVRFRASGEPAETFGVLESGNYTALPSEGSPTAISGAFAGPSMTANVAHTGRVEVDNASWVEGAQPVYYAALLARSSSALGHVAQIHVFPGIGIGTAIATEANELAVGAVVGAQSIVPGVGGPVTLEPSTDLQALVFSDTFVLKRRFLLMRDSLDAGLFLTGPARLLPELHPRPGGGYALIAPLREGQTFGSGESQATIASLEPGLAIVYFDPFGAIKWLRRVRWMSGVDPVLVDGVSPLHLMFGDALVRADGSVVLGGTLTGTLAVDTGNGETAEIRSPDGDRDGWLAGFAADGRLLFAFDAVSGPGRGSVGAIGEQSDHALVAAGTFEGPTDFGFGADAGAINDVAGFGAYVMRVNTAGGLDCGGAFDGVPTE